MSGRRHIRIPGFLTAAVVVTVAVAVVWVGLRAVVAWIVGAWDWLCATCDRIGAALTSAWPLLKWVLIGVAVLLVALGVWRLVLAVRRLRGRQLARRAGPALTIDDIDRLDDRQFEFLVGELWRAQGFTIEVTQRGISDCDVVARHGDLTIAIDAKHRIADAVVDVQEVLKVPGYMAKYQAAGGTVRGAVVTNRTFAEPAREAASWKKEVDLVDREKLTELLAQHPVTRAALRAAMGEWQQEHKGGAG